MTAGPQRELPAVFMRGGTSKAVIFKAGDLPADRSSWGGIFLSVMGSPDPNGRQLDGMGGGISSLSKVCIVGPASIPDADVDYTFAQVPVGDGQVDFSGNCGNMSSAIGPFAVDEGLVDAPEDGEAAVRIHNTNTSKIIVSRFAVRGGKALVAGNQQIDGVAGEGAPIRLEFVEPGGTKTGRLLPTGHAVDTLDVDGVGPIAVSIVDAANPCVFVDAGNLGKSGIELPDELESDAAFLEKMETIRRSAAVAMGVARDMAAAGAIARIPMVAIVAPPQDAATLSQRTLDAGSHHIAVRMLSMGRPHRAIPVTGALCLAIAMRIPGSLANRYLGDTAPAALRIAHPSGIVDVDAVVSPDSASGELRAVSGTLVRTARRLFAGTVYFRTPPGMTAPKSTQVT